MRKHIVTIGFALIALLAVFSAHLLNPEDSNFAGRAFANSLHAPGFGVVAIIAYLLIRRHFSSVSAYFFAAFVAFGIGVVSEALQIASDRDASLIDLLNDIVGIAAFLGILFAMDPELRGSRSRFRAAALSVFAVALLVLSLSPTIWYGYAVLAQRAAAPSILSFDETWHREVWRVSGQGELKIHSAPSNWPLRGRVAYLSHTLSDDPTFTIQPFSDWTGYDTFSFVAASADGESRAVVVRINDRAHNNAYGDRFNQRLNITSEPQQFRFSLDDIRSSPDSRDMDLTAVSDIILFIRDEHFEGTIIVDDFRIE